MKEYKRLHILIDMDEVVCNLLDKWISWINNTYDEDLKREEITQWQVHPFCPKAGTNCYKFFDEDDVFTDLEPIPGAIDHINKLRKAGHRIQFCTSLPQNNQKGGPEKIKWLEKHFKWFDKEHDVIFSDDKGSELGDVLFDDRFKWLVEFPKISIAMDAPYNQKWSGFRVNNWKDFSDLIGNLSKVVK